MKIMSTSNGEFRGKRAEIGVYDDAMNCFEDDVPAHRKKSKKKGQPRADHKHIYETVLLIRNYHFNDFKTGRPKIKQTSSPTKVCTVCGRIDDIDKNPKYYVNEPVHGLPFEVYKKELSEEALALPKWMASDFFDKFAVKMEEEE